MPKKDRIFVLHGYTTVAEADRAFYQSYDALFLARKVELLYEMYRNSTAILAASQGWERPIGSVEEELRTLLATELHCTVFHQTEAVIALLLAEYQDKPDWVYLTTYGNAEIKEAASAIANNQSIPRTTASGMKDLVKTAVYARFDLSKISEVAAQWERSISSIISLLQIISEQFIDAHEYNSYKHGLRVVLGSASLGVAQGDLADQKIAIVSSMRHAMTFLQLERLKDGDGAQMVTKQVIPEYSSEVVRCLASLASTIKSFRLARINGAPPDEMLFPVFDTVLLDRIKPVSKFGISY